MSIVVDGAGNDDDDGGGGGDVITVAVVIVDVEFSMTSMICALFSHSIFSLSFLCYLTNEKKIEKEIK